MARSAPWMGMQGVGDWETNQIPDNYRELIMWLDPNGTAPLLAMSSKAGKSRATDNSDFNYYTQYLPRQGGTYQSAGIYADQSLLTAYTTGGVAGDTLYAQVAASSATRGVALVGEFTPGQQVVLRYTVDPTADVVAKVVRTRVNGNSSWVELKLLENDDNSSNGFDLSDSDEILIIGTAHGQGSFAPDAVNYVPTSVAQHTQIFKDTIELSGTNLETNVRTAKDKSAKLKNARFEKLLMHGYGIEKALIFSVLNEGTADNGESEWTMMGINEFVATYNSAGIVDYTRDATYSGNSWLESGEDWLEENLEPNFRYKARNGITPGERLGMTGNLGLLAINKLVRSAGQPELKIGAKAYGFKVYEWITPVGVVNLIVSPVFNDVPSLRRSLYVMHPSNLNYVNMRNRDTKRTDITTPGFDGVRELFQTEACFELLNAPMWSILHNLGLDNLV